jgi:hypothetical protein
MNLNNDPVNTAEAHQPNIAFADEVPLGFISYPKNIPLNAKHIWRLPELTADEVKSGESELGLCFTSNKHHKIGTLMEVTISMRGDDHIFVGQVVLIKGGDRGYNVGVWLRSQTDACRARIIEQICYMDSSLETGRQHSLATIKKEKGMREWIYPDTTQLPA